MADRILIADPTATNRIILKVKLAAARYEALQAATGRDALAIARAERPDLVIVSAQLPDQSAAEVCAALKRDPRSRAIPVLIVDALGNRDDRLAALRAGADDYLTKPLDELTLLALVRHLMRTRATYDEFARRQDTIEELGFGEPRPGFVRPARVAVIAPTPDTGLVWRRDLGRRLDLRVKLLTKAEALDTMAPGEVPDAFLIAADLAGPGDGLRLVSELRSRAATRHAVIVIQDEAGEVETVPMALDLGASAVVPGRFDAEELAARLGVLLARKLETDALRDSVEHRLGLATRDPLTGLYNRRYAEAYLARVAEEARLTDQPFALMLLDLDRFKDVNDTHGHLVGDEVLIEIARRLRVNLREIDLVARHGGEEFLVAMPETDLAAARAAAERLRRVVGERPVRSPSQGKDVAVTVSIGVTVCHANTAAAGMATLIEQADMALYASKHEGRNLVTLAGDAAA
jgi:two-component system, cell cycle response regulator